MNLPTYFVWNFYSNCKRGMQPPQENILFTPQKQKKSDIYEEELHHNTLLEYSVKLFFFKSCH